MNNDTASSPRPKAELLAFFGITLTASWLLFGLAAPHLGDGAPAWALIVLLLGAYCPSLTAIGLDRGAPGAARGP